MQCKNCNSRSFSTSKILIDENWDSPNKPITYCNVCKWSEASNTTEILEAIKAVDDVFTAYETLKDEQEVSADNVHRAIKDLYRSIL